MAELPSASILIDDEAGPSVAGTGYCVVVGCVATADDITPRVFSSAKALLATHGYSQAADYAAIHIESTRKPVIFVGLPIDTAGAAGSVTTTRVDAETPSTCVVTVTADSNGILEELDVKVTVVTGGTIAAAGIVLELTCDGGRITKRIRLGTATTYTIPHVGVVLNFDAGTLLAGDTFEFTTTAPMWSTDDIATARTALASQQKYARSWLVVGDIADADTAGAVVTAIDAYETENARFSYARINVRDYQDSDTTMAQYVSAMDTAFAAIDGEKRIDISLGRARRLSPITGWKLRRSASWALSVREYQHDIQIPAWRKSDGPMSGWDMTDGSGTTVEFDESTIGGALAARFSCLRTWPNGPNGTFGALSLTRASEGSLLSRTHNLAVANLACTVTQSETENAVGTVLVLDDDGHATPQALQVIEERVNSALQTALLAAGVEGPRASKAVWSASRTDVLNVPAAELTGVLDLELNGTLEKISTRVRIQTGG